MRDDPTTIAPERAIVFEIAGSVQKFYKAASRIPGLEYLAEDDFQFAADADFAERDQDGQLRLDRPVRGRRYLLMPSVVALEQIVNLYKRWRRGRAPPRNFTPWRDLFLQLKDLRPWGPQDRVSDAAIETWQEEITAAGVTEALVEAELFFHNDAARRAAALSEVRQAVHALGGTTVADCTITEIGYQAALLRLPVAGLRQVMERRPVQLVLADQVMFLSPQSTIRGPALEPLAPQTRSIAPLPAPPALPAIAALLDGFPLQQHALLANRLNIDDGDDLEPRATVNRRFHGTAMASLILHGDLNAAQESLQRPLHVRPIMFAPAGQREQTASDRLLVDTIYRAIVAMKDPSIPGGPTAPDVFLVNLALGDRRRPFTSPISPIGRLLDYLAHRYGILFLVSAGNTTDAFVLGQYANMGQAEAATVEDITEAFLTLLRDQGHLRTLLAPAEALNPLTIGAAHSDNVPAAFPHRNTLDPFPRAHLPNLSSALGLGHRRVVKPDLLLPGGRERLVFRGSPPLALGFSEVPQGYGLRAATPDAAARATLDRSTLLCGTSAATALATRAAHQIFDVLTDAAGGSHHADIDPEYWAVVVKALLIHAARWPEDSANLIVDLFGPTDRRRHNERADNISRLLGYGMPDISRVLECTPERATLVGYGELRADGAHEYRIPLPQCLELVTDPRTVILTLAWMSPVTVTHQDYRRAQLQIDAPGHTQRIGVDRLTGLQPSDSASKRGSVIHEIHHGENAVAFIDDGVLVVRVWCLARPDYVPLLAPIRYGLAVTIEAGTALPVYQQTDIRLRALVAGQQP